MTKQLKHYLVLLTISKITPHTLEFMDHFNFYQELFKQGEKYELYRR